MDIPFNMRAHSQHHSQPTGPAPAGRSSRYPGLKLSVVALLAFAAIPQQASAVDKYWVCGSDGWDNGSCWSIPGQPNTGDNAYLLQNDSQDRSVSYINTLYPSAHIGDLTIDATGAGSMTLLQSQDTLSTTREYIGFDGSGAMLQTGGTNAGRKYVGYNSTSSGSYTLDGGIMQGTMDVGYAGSGVMDHISGSNTMFDSRLYLGSQASGDGTYNLHAGTLTTEDGSYVGVYGNGTFNQYGGSHLYGSATSLSAQVWVGRFAGSTGTYNFYAGTMSGQGTQVGVGGTGTFNQMGGDHHLMGGDSSNFGLRVGVNSSGVGSYNMSAGTITTLREYVGENGTGTFNQSGGTNTINRDGGNQYYGLHLGYGTTGNGTYNLSNGTLASYHLNIGRNGTGAFNQTGGTVDISGSYGGLPASPGRELDTGGNLWMGEAAGGTGSYDLSAGSLSTNNTVVGKSGDATFNQSGGTHTVADTLSLAENAGSSGSYTLSGGTLDATNIVVNGGSFNFDGGTLVVDTFTGNLINNGGTLAPGNSPGTTNIVGDYTQLAGSYDVEIAGTGAGEYDVLNVTGTANLGGGLNVSFFDAGGGLYNAGLGDTFDILFAENINGEFDLLSLAPLDSGLKWDINYLADALGSLDVVRLSVSAVPLPGAVWLFGTGLVGLIGVGRRRKPKQEKDSADQ